MKRSLIPLVAALSLLLPPAAIVAAPFGNPPDTADAKQLWKAMVAAKLVGERAFLSTPYKGIFPHGDFLDTVDGFLTVGKHTGRLIIKRNYGGEGVTREMVSDRPYKYLKAVTVMYQREQGYDSENQNWFYGKYSPAGDLLKNPKGMLLAGRVAKGVATEGCIACHKGAPGGDMLFNNNRRP